MPADLGPRFVLEVGFLILLAVVLGLADLSPALIILVMAVGWLLVALLEYFAWRQSPAPSAAVRYEEGVGPPRTRPSRRRSSRTLRRRLRLPRLPQRRLPLKRKRGSSLRLGLPNRKRRRSSVRSRSNTRATASSRCNLGPAAGGFSSAPVIGSRGRLRVRVKRSGRGGPWPDKLSARIRPALQGRSRLLETMPQPVVKLDVTQMAA